MTMIDIKKGEMTMTGLRIMGRAAIAAAVLAAGIGGAAAQGPVNKIKQRGYVSCGASQGVPGRRT